MYLLPSCFDMDIVYLFGWNTGWIKNIIIHSFCNTKYLLENVTIISVIIALLSSKFLKRSLVCLFTGSTPRWGDRRMERENNIRELVSRGLSAYLYNSHIHMQVVTSLCSWVCQPTFDADHVVITWLIPCHRSRHLSYYHTWVTITGVTCLLRVVLEAMKALVGTSVCTFFDRLLSRCWQLAITVIRRQPCLLSLQQNGVIL